MYCSGCGTEIQAGLNYCSRCGRRIAETQKPFVSARTNPLVVAGQTAGVGFIAFIFVMLVLVRYGVPGNNIIPIAFFYFAALFGLCAMFLKYGSAQRGARDVENAAESAERAYLRPVTTAQLEEPREFPAASVTDHTTRTLEEAPLKRI